MSAEKIPNNSDRLQIALAMEPLIRTAGAEAVNSVLDEINLSARIDGGAVLEAWLDRSRDFQGLRPSQVAEIVYSYMRIACRRA